MRGFPKEKEVMRDAIAHDAVAAAINLASHIHAVREELETTRRVPRSLVQAINDAGLFRPYLPHALGGLELPPLTVFRVIEELSKVDGSVGWCTMIASSMSLLSGWLPTDLGRALFG
jgi:alkylation response protein AidB-like acyl-CoA dehydrogenase